MSGIKRIYILLFMIVGLVYCRPADMNNQPTTSETAAIGTDLPDTGHDGDVTLFWVVDGRIFRGECEGRDTVIPLCSNNMSSMRYSTFREELDGGLSDLVRELSGEARRIQRAIEIIRGRIDRTLAAIEELERQNGELSEEVRALRSRMQRFSAAVEAYQEQLALIDDALRRVISDPDLLAQRQIVMDALSRYQHQLGQIAARLPDLLRQIRLVRDRIADLRDELTSLNTRLANLNHELEIVNTRLNLALDDFSVFESTLVKLNSGIIYTALSDNEIARRERQFIRRFERIFGNQS